MGSHDAGPHRPVAGSDLFAEIARGDLFVHHPYESFATSFEAFVRAASTDPDVTAIKTTVYRTSGDSPLVAGARRRGRGRASRASASSS